MMKLPIGVVIKTMMDEKRLKVVHVAEQMGLSKTAIYQSFAKLEMSESELARWASVLETEPEHILARRDNAMNAVEGGVRRDDSYLIDHLTRLEETFNQQVSRLMTEIDVKNKQIEGLQNTVNVLLGKSEDVTNLMTTLMTQAIAKPAKLAAATA